MSFLFPYYDLLPYFPQFSSSTPSSLSGFRGGTAPSTAARARELCDDYPAVASPLRVSGQTSLKPRRSSDCSPHSLFGLTFCLATKAMV